MNRPRAPALLVVIRCSGDRPCRHVFRATPMDLDDTIVAVSTPAGAADRAIIRLSGPAAVAIASRAFLEDCGEHGDAGRPQDAILAWPTYTARSGRLTAAGPRLAVPAVCYLMRRPRSYTRQDVVEFHVGGWPAVLPRLVEGFLALGARAAEPGEFTFRALVNGRIDLAQAEAVMAVVSAGSAAALRAAGDLLAGRLSHEVQRLAGSVRELLAAVEAGLDFSDQDIEIIAMPEVALRARRLRDELVALGRRSRTMETFGGDVRLVLAGRPSVGKSSLFNRLLETDRAIVSPRAGTTRDELRATLHIGPYCVTLCDVAGIDECPPAAGPERTDGAQGSDLALLARSKALEAIGRADLVLLVLDAAASSYDSVAELVSLAAAPMLVAISKCDLAAPDRAMAWLASRGLAAGAVATSALTGQGIDELREALVRALEGGAIDRQSAGPVLMARHRAALEEAALALGRAGQIAELPCESGELVALELRQSLARLGEIVQAGPNVLDEIFSRFCVGK